MKKCICCGGEIPQDYLDKGFTACKASCKRKYEGFLKEKSKNPNAVFRVDSKPKRINE